jgi:release factor glutamine methyltransferase
MAEPGTELWTTRRLLSWMAEAFARQRLDSPRLSAEIVLSHVIGCERIRLYMDPERPCDSAELSRLRSLVARALRHEPVQYLTGEAWFFGLPMHADRRALIPRPCTEAIVEHVLQALRAGAGPVADGPADAAPLVADVCTGSGCVAVALARRSAAARVVATDISPDALALAAENASRHGVSDRIELLAGDLLEPLAARLSELGRRADHLVANPPYIPDHEWPDVPPNVREHEPELALRAPPDGMPLVARLIEGGPELVRPGGTVMIELAACTAPRALSLAQSHPLLTEARLVKDLDGLDRFVLARRVG